MRADRLKAHAPKGLGLKESRRPKSREGPTQAGGGGQGLSSQEDRAEWAWLWLKPASRLWQPEPGHACCCSSHLPGAGCEGKAAQCSGH